MKTPLKASFIIIVTILVAGGLGYVFKDTAKTIESNSDTSMCIFVDAEHKEKCSATFLPNNQISYKYEHNRPDGCQFNLKGTGDLATIEYVKFGDTLMLPSDVYVSRIGKCVLFLKIDKVDHTRAIIIPGNCEDRTDRQLFIVDAF